MLFASGTFQGEMGRGAADEQPARASRAPLRAPSQAARTIAGAIWGEVQHQDKLAPGIYRFDTPGHGGIVAVIGQADLPENYVQAARDSGRVELMVTVKTGSHRTRSYTSERYTPESLRELHQRANAGREGTAELQELWVGEEDCEYATILLAAGAQVRAKDASRMIDPEKWLQGAGSDEALYEFCRENCEDFLMALDPDYEIKPDGRIAKARRRQRLLDEGELIRRSALGVGDDRVHVLFEAADGQMVGRYMSAATYKRVDDDLATLGDFERLEELEEAPPGFFGGSQ